MKQVFCKGLAAFNFKHNRSYAAVVAADSTSRGPMGSNDRKGLGLIPKKALSSDKWSKKPFTNHKVTMCNSDRNINVSNTVTTKHALPARSFHKRPVDQKRLNTSAQALPVHNRFRVLQTDTQTQDTNSTTALLPIIAGYQLSPPENKTFIFQ